jgi:hypothetical protein
MPSWASSLPSTPSFRPYGRFVSRSLPHHALGGLTSRPACVSRCCGAEGLVDPSRGYRLAWVSPPSDRHSATRAVRRAGVWIRLTDRARCKRHDPIQAPSLRPDQSFRPGLALPSFGERLLPLPFGQIDFVYRSVTFYGSTFQRIRLSIWFITRRPCGLMGPTTPESMLPGSGFSSFPCRHARHRTRRSRLP